MDGRTLTVISVEETMDSQLWICYASGNSCYAIGAPWTAIVPIVTNLGALRAQESIHAVGAGRLTPSTVLRVRANFNTIISRVDLKARWDGRAVLLARKGIVVGRTAGTGSLSFACVVTSRALHGDRCSGVLAVVTLGASLAHEVEWLGIVSSQTLNGRVVVDAKVALLVVGRAWHLVLLSEILTVGAVWAGDAVVVSVDTEAAVEVDRAAHHGLAPWALVIIWATPAVFVTTKLVAARGAWGYLHPGLIRLNWVARP